MPTLSSAEQLLALAGPCTLLVSPTNYDRLKASGKFGIRGDIAGSPLQWQGTVGTVFVRPTAAANPQPAQFEWHTDELVPVGERAVYAENGPVDPEEPVVLTEGHFEWGDPVEGYGVTQNVRLNIAATDFG